VVMVMIFGLFAFSNLATHQAMQMQMAMQYQQMEMQRAAQGLPPLGQAQNPENQQAAGMGDAVGPQRPESAQAQPPAAESGTGKPNDQAMPPGVPLPADEVLE
ncbi:MAG: hypothetical protein EB119_11070, partial [Synechococcaceae bacterium WBB_34_004]|nr:hypothetical protein [Synechococcaceae bacterium WBB_34_004]